MNHFLPFLALALLIQPTLRAQQPPPAYLVILHAHVWTVDGSHPTAQAVAISRSRIAATGSDDEIKKRIGSGTKQIDAHSKTVLPGFIDAHVHFRSGGAEISGVHLRDAATPQEFAHRIAEHARKLAKGEWMAGGAWDHELWGGTLLPSHDWIDAGTPHTPTFVTRYDGHMALANALALRLAKVTRETPDPPGGTIVRDVNGDPTWLMKDAAMSIVYSAIPDSSEEQLLRDTRTGLEEARRFGVTSFLDISGTRTCTPTKF